MLSWAEHEGFFITSVQDVHVNLWFAFVEGKALENGIHSYKNLCLKEQRLYTFL